MAGLGACKWGLLVLLRGTGEGWLGAGAAAAASSALSAAGTACGCLPTADLGASTFGEAC